MVKFFFPLIPSNHWVSKTAPLQMILKLNIVDILIYSILTFAATNIIAS